MTKIQLDVFYRILLNSKRIGLFFEAHYGEIRRNGNRKQLAILLREAADYIENLPNSGL